MSKRSWSDANEGMEFMTVLSALDVSREYNEAVLQDIESLHATLKEIAKKVGASEPAALQSTTLRNSTDSPSQNGRPASTTNGNGYRLGVSGQDNHGPSCDNSPKISPEDENLPHVPIHSLYALTKLRALRSPDAPEGHSSPALDDFIARGAIRLDDAERLFRLYRDRLDPFMQMGYMVYAAQSSVA
ncbi:Transcriptional activator of proteases prtT [Colletotrichum sp. SAR 10_99]|nr:Transcriptional activator of proteases prtT [Colletotrichum sp. SAR 10_98]KAJ5011348.1 Transcriptional activator of proteases prtT [Colletotrichum sp. SAR 10_99]